MSAEMAIDTRGLSKHFNGAHAVRGIDLQVPRGTVFGLLGPRGAGKTTTMRMLSALLLPSGGEARVLGHDLEREPQTIRARVNLTGQFTHVDDTLSGQETLTRVARLHGISGLGSRVRTNTLLKALGLLEAAPRPVKLYSQSMRRRLDIAASLVLPPELLLLDEPTEGLDPLSRRRVWDMVRALRAEGTTVFLSTQQPEEAEQLADRIAVLEQGKVVAEHPLLGDIPPSLTDQRTTRPPPVADRSLD
ncbi:ABC transporter ATP-binding protein [Marinimicrobium agarilyticum]|uniref:ABC transporter ATP-binding protein n=1 Tax=Marinimicrobium agarilyticum TaxID=306546 RepID=UPI000414DF11|nr:ATP-binding cassette domain-containing protein [Marinimicrobium agarilyticum]